MSRATPPPSPLERPADPPEFPYGWRFVTGTRPDGSTDWEQVPLTLEDVLHPQEGDVIPRRSRHEIECGYLAAVLRSRGLDPSVVRVTADLLIDWGVPSLRNHSPDVAVFAGLREEPDLNAGTFHLADSRGRRLLVVEIVSPDTRVNDAVIKVEHYYRAGVPHYVLVDQEREGGPRQLVGYRPPGVGQYEREVLDAEGRLALPEVGLLLGLREGQLICLNQATGKEYLDPASAYREVQRRAAMRTGLEAKEQVRLEVEQARQAEERAHQAAARVQELEELIRKMQGAGQGEGGTPTS
jgi:colicin import membrane protein